MTSEISNFSEWDIVFVPFPFVENSQTKKRPALIVSNSNFNARNRHVIAAMITSSFNSIWHNDYVIEDLNSAGLPKKCLVRLKLFTLPIELIQKKIGCLGEGDREKMKAIINDTIGT